ncbi:lipoprotein signal peptidase [Beggiatoa alba B18LD]|uniref:Lipoprotein signal peptidase n=1 Tax=Beggiatoa alba B18LD TaxID=395493 RepID=I3CJX1_9GAMM|nr:signal peptidase II [Beggiatoa alba]EIJ43914.1 lipoprotein signal peptidase [Beggiatoa alba B18LD]
MAYSPIANAPRYRALWWLSLSLLVLIIDQLTKLWANSALVYHEPYPILPFLNFTLVYNTGAAFSFLAEAGGWQRYFLTGLAIVISLVMIIWLSRLSSQQKWLAATLALILGGAIGNLIDRVLYGYVIDFIDVYYQTWHFPAFNIADSAITVGAIMLLIDALWLSHSQHAPYSS